MEASAGQPVSASCSAGELSIISIVSICVIFACIAGVGAFMPSRLLRVGN